MLDFTSALYLGMRHPHCCLRPWRTLTTGRPAALEEPPGAEAAAQELAGLIGCEQAVLATSTLHVFWDLFETLAGEGIALFIDSSSYPIARWGAERAAAKGVPVIFFPQHDSAALERKLLRCGKRRPVILTDGLDPATGRPAPLPQYLRLVQERGGWLIVDDTQALGILGRRVGNAGLLTAAAAAEQRLGTSYAGQDWLSRLRWQKALAHRWLCWPAAGSSLPNIKKRAFAGCIAVRPQQRRLQQHLMRCGSISTGAHGSGTVW